MNAVAKHQPQAVAKPNAEQVQYVTPSVNIYATEDGYLLEADLPGVTRNGIEIYLDQNELTFVGRRTQSVPETVHYRESTDGDYRRVFELDPEIDTDKITARVENGVLTLNLAKRESVKPRRIAVAD